MGAFAIALMPTLLPSTRETVYLRYAAFFRRSFHYRVSRLNGAGRRPDGRARAPGYQYACYFDRMSSTTGRLLSLATRPQHRRHQFFLTFVLPLGRRKHTIFGEIVSGRTR